MIEIHKSKNELFVKLVTRAVLAFWLIVIIAVTAGLGYWLSQIPIHKLFSAISLIAGYILLAVIIEGTFTIILHFLKRFSVTIAGEKVTGDIILLYIFLISLIVMTVVIAVMNHYGTK